MSWVEAQTASQLVICEELSTRCRNLANKSYQYLFTISIKDFGKDNFRILLPRPPGEGWIRRAHREVIFEYILSIDAIRFSVFMICKFKKEIPNVQKAGNCFADFGCNRTERV